MTATPTDTVRDFYDKLSGGDAPGALGLMGRSRKLGVRDLPPAGPLRVGLAYTPDSRWQNRVEFPNRREEDPGLPHP